MNGHFFSYLIESSAYLLSFLVVYRLVISNQTHFNWMRGYLLLSLIFSVVLPFVALPSQWTNSISGHSLAIGSFPININPFTLMTSNTTVSSTQLAHYLNPWMFLLMAVSIIYILGLFYKSVILIGKVNKILTKIKKNVKRQEGAYWLVDIDMELPAFSFFNYIFINKNYKKLTNEDILRIKNHEIIHAKQWHTLDILFVELISVIFWFNPLVLYTKSKLQEIHEFIADEQTAGQGEMKKDYAQLLLNLATDNKSLSLMTGFSGNQIAKRILMVTKNRSIRWSKLLIISLLPIAFALLVSFSYFDFTPAPLKNSDSELNSASVNHIKIGDIKWLNNKVFTTSELNSAFSLKKGDAYTNEAVEKGLYDKVSDLYIDRGYLFIKIEKTEIHNGERVMDLIFTVNEGDRFKIGTIQVKGNKTVSTTDILSKISLKQGDFFSKAKLIESVRMLSMWKKFDPETIKPDLNPEKKNPQSEFGTVNIIFGVTEK